jgi:glycosyltransferase involved in cell wall biosynthesis
VRIVAIFAVHNEERIIRRAIRHLAGEGVLSYVMDNDSTDQTYEAVRSMEGEGVIGHERLPRAGTFQLADHLRRKEQLHHELAADWYVHHDADEIRQSPLPGQTLAEGIAAEDAAGYDAIDFLEFAFMPTSQREDFEHEGYVEEMRHYCFMQRKTGARFRINAWKNRGQRVDLASSGGHSAEFEGRKVCPRKFILRHYLALSYDHVVRKYCQRRYSDQELQDGWHWTRATLRPEDIYLPDISELKELPADGAWDMSDPWTDEPIFKNAPRPVRRKREGG